MAGLVYLEQEEERTSLGLQAIDLKVFECGLSYSWAS